MRSTACILVALVIGCSTEEPAVDSCDPDETDAPASYDGLAIGVVANGDFVAIGDGDAMELVLGPQGGWMIMPVVRLDAPEVGGEVACAAAVVDVDVGAGDLVVSQNVPLTLQLIGGYGYSPELPVFLSFDLLDLEGRQATLAAAVGGMDATAIARVQIQLVNGN